MSEARRLEPRVTTIPATRNPFTAAAVTAVRKRRVAAYARVSTDQEEQQTSYEAQIDYYTKYIQERADWEYIAVYTDDGVTGTNTRQREGFNRMVRDALDGKIDLIVTKSVSRFARNTVDSLVTVRKLKEAGVEVFFEKENIFTFDGKGELLITIMSSLAQEESRSISENVTWGQRKRFADGKVSMPYKRFLGYDKGSDGTPVVNEEEAKVVRLIYSLYLRGKTSRAICRQLEDEGIPTPSGGQKWSETTVSSILRNEKYKGDALLQKRFTVDFLTKKMIKNEGQVQQFYVEGSHEGIVSVHEFDMVQAEIARRKRLGRSYSGNSIFATRLICGDCGGHYGQKVWHSNDSYRRTIWRCNGKFKRDHKCQTATLTALTIQQMFLKAYSQMMQSREQVIEDCETMQHILTDCSEIDAKIARLTEEMAVVAGLVSTGIRENASNPLSQEEFNEKRNTLVKRYERLEAKVKKLEEDKIIRRGRERELKMFIDAIRSRALVLDEWDEEVWLLLLEKGTVFADGHINFEFKNGTVIAVGA